MSSRLSPPAPCPRSSVAPQGAKEDAPLLPIRLLSAVLALLLVVATPSASPAQTGTVSSFQKISDTAGSFTGVLDDADFFGESVTSLGDLDGDGVIDLAVGATNDDDGGSNQGAVWVLFMNTDGTVSSFQKIRDTDGGFAGVLDVDDAFGMSVVSPGDLDGDGTEDLVVGSPYDDDGSTNCGAVWVLFLNTDGTVDSHQKISDTEGGALVSWTLVVTLVCLCNPWEIWTAMGCPTLRWAHRATTMEAWIGVRCGCCL